MSGKQHESMPATVVEIKAELNGSVLIGLSAATCKHQMWLVYKLSLSFLEARCKGDFLLQLASKASQTVKPRTFLTSRNIISSITVTVEATSRKVSDSW